MNHLVFGSRELKAIEVTLFHMCTSIYKIFLACLLCRFFFFFFFNAFEVKQCSLFSLLNFFDKRIFGYQIG